MFSILYKSVVQSFPLSRSVMSG